MNQTDEKRINPLDLLLVFNNLTKKFIQDFSIPIELHKINYPKPCF